MSVLTAVRPPEGWQSVPFGRVVTRSKESGRPDLQPLSVFLGIGVVPRASRDDNHNQLGENLGNYLVVRPGDLVFNKLRTWQGGLGASTHEGIVSPAYFVCRPGHDYDSRFLHYLLTSGPYLQELTRVSKWQPPSQFDIGWEQLRAVPIVAPGLATQRTIADYLDAETARIDALIAKKKRMTELVGERSRSAVAEATRHGLSTTSPMVDSGLPWVGKIPSHWKVVPNRSTMRFLRQTITPGREPTLLSLTKRGVIVRDVSENAGKFPASFDTYQVAESGQLVFCLFDIPETPRTVGLVTQSGMVTGAYVVASPRPGVSPEYLRFLYEGFDDEKSLSLFYTGLRKVIRPETFLGIRMPLPPFEEQVAIANHLTSLAENCRRVALLLNKQIELLVEHRQALITAAVTGELDVPGVAA